MDLERYILTFLTHQEIRISAARDGGGGDLLVYRLSLNQDGLSAEGIRKYSVSEGQGVREGLLQEEWSADTLGLCGSDRLCAWIYTPVIQPLHTGMN